MSLRNIPSRSSSQYNSSQSWPFWTRKAPHLHIIVFPFDLLNHGYGEQNRYLHWNKHTHTHTHTHAHTHARTHTHTHTHTTHTHTDTHTTQTHTHTHARTHARTAHTPHTPHTHTHTHTHMLGFHVLWGLSIDVMVFILYKLYILSPYTAPIPKPNHHRRHSAILHFQKTSLSLIYKLVSSWGPKMSPHGQGFWILPSLWGHFVPIT